MSCKLLTDAQVIELLGLTGKHPREQLRHLRRRYRLGYVKLGRMIRYTEGQVEEFVKRHCVEAAS